MKATRVSPADKEAGNSSGRFQVCVRMSVVQFDTLLAVLEPHIKKKTTNFCEPIGLAQQLKVRSK